jgi:subtilisin family serine protease
MIGKRKIGIGIVLCLLVFLTSAGVNSVTAVDLPPLDELNGVSTITALSEQTEQKSGESFNPNMDAGINKIVSDYKKSKSRTMKVMNSDSKTVKKEKLIATKTPEIINGRVKVYLDLEDKQADVSKLQEKYDLTGIITTDFSETLAQANVPVENLEDLASEDSVKFIRVPVKVIVNSEPSMEDITSPITSEGVLLMQADRLHSEGIKGDKIKVAIIDKGFANYELCSEINNNIFETKSFAGDNDISGDKEFHGTAVSEIISDFAPNASFFFYRVETPLEFVEAINRATSQEVDIISSSLAFFCADPETFKIIKEVEKKGIITVSGAGNHADKHFKGIITDTDGDGWLKFPKCDEKIDETIDLGWIVVNDGEKKVFNIYLDWGEWPKTEKDYDLYLLSEEIDGFREVASSKANNIGNPPIEFLGITITGPSMFKLHIAILQVKGENAEIEIFTNGIDIQEHRIPYGSITLPGRIDEGITIGAIDCVTQEIESYSSRGNELDFVGPTWVSTWSYRSFGGTSAAVPHIAGAFALLKGAFPEATNEEILQALQQTALNLGPEGKDPMYGDGLPLVYDAYEYLLSLQQESETPENYSINETVNSSEAVMITNQSQ